MGGHQKGTQWTKLKNSTKLLIEQKFKMEKLDAEMRVVKNLQNNEVCLHKSGTNVNFSFCNYRRSSRKMCHS